MKNLNSKLFKDYELNKQEIKEVKGGAVGTSIFSDTNSTKESSSSHDIKTKWSFDSTSSATDVFVEDYEMNPTKP